MAGYSVLAVPFYTWYAFPILFLGLLLAGLGVQACYELWMEGTKDKSLMQRGGLLLGGLALLIVAGTGVLRLSQSMAEPADPVRRLYTKAGEWLQKETPKEASVGFFEIGFVGYYSQRRMVDPVGLVNADVSAHVAKGDFTWAFKHYEPDYILLTPARWVTRIGKIREEEWFKARYELATTIGVPGYYDSPLSIYRKR